MNPTQNPDNTAPEPALPTTGTRFFDLLDKVPGGVGIRATLLAGLEAATDESVTYELTETGRNALDNPASDEEPVAFVAVHDRCEVCGREVPWPPTWKESLCADCAVVIPVDNPSNEGVAGSASQSTYPVDLVTETDGETTARVLRSAATYLERHGWIQGSYYDATSGMFTPAACLVGAIGMVCYGGPVDAPAQHFDDPGFLDFEAAVLHLDRYLLVEDGSESYEFNDARGRRLEDVTRVLRDAAARPAGELIDALRVIDVRNADNAALAHLVTPSGVFADTEPVIEIDLDEFVDFVCHGRLPASFTERLDTGVDVDGGDA